MEGIRLKIPIHLNCTFSCTKGYGKEFQNEIQNPGHGSKAKMQKSSVASAFKFGVSRKINVSQPGNESTSMPGNFFKKGGDLEQPWNELPEAFKKTIIYGSGGEKIHLEYESEDGSLNVQREREVQGAVHHINRLFRQTKSESMRRRYMQFMSQQPCPTCQGERLCVEARFVTVDGKRFSELSTTSIRELHEWVSSLPERLDEDQRFIGEELLTDTQNRATLSHSRHNQIYVMNIIHIMLNIWVYNMSNRDNTLRNLLFNPLGGLPLSNVQFLKGR